MVIIIFENKTEQEARREILELVKEYAFTDEAKMMGHVWKNGNGIVVAAKGSPEHILKICNLTADEKKIAENKIEKMPILYMPNKYTLVL